MKRLSTVALAALVVLALVGFSKPSYAREFKECLDSWESFALKKCTKGDGPEAIQCLEKADLRFNKCVKKAENIDKSGRKQMKKCLNKRGLDKEEFGSQTKGKRKKAVAKYIKWADKCQAKIIK